MSDAVCVTDWQAIKTLDH